MTAAEKLRMELAQNVPFSKEEFIQYIYDVIKGSMRGCAKFVCDSHIGETTLKHGASCKRCHEDILTEWARSEGFNVSHHYNGYGVHYLVFHL